MKQYEEQPSSAAREVVEVLFHSSNAGERAHCSKMRGRFTESAQRVTISNRERGSKMYAFEEVQGNGEK